MQKSSNSDFSPSSDVKTLQEKILQANKSIIRKDREDPKKFVCRACKKKKKYNYSGKWYNCQGHLDSKAHKNALLEFNEDDESEREESKQADSEKEETMNNKSENSMVHGDLLYNPQNIDQSYIMKINSELKVYFMKFILENRLPFSIAKNLHAFVSEICEKFPPKPIRSFRVTRQNIVKLTQEMCRNLKSQLYDQLRCTPFSLSIDASSDIYGSTYLAICAKHIDSKNPDQVLNKLVTILPITTSSTGEVLFEKVTKELLFDEEIQKNFMGICADQGSNMIGNEKGLCSRLKKQFPYIIVVKDFSHIYNTIFKKGLKAVPESIIKIITEICKHFGYSTQRKACLDEIQIENNMPRLGVMNFSETRWLSLRDCLKRILDIWSSLGLYFEAYGTKKEKGYFDEKNEAYLRVLYILIDQLSNYNVFFQQENIYFDEILEKIQESFVLFYNMVAKKDEKELDFGAVYNLPFESLKDKDLVKGSYQVFEPEIESRKLNFKDDYIVQYDLIKVLFSKLNEKDKDEIVETSIKFIFLVLKYMKKKLPFEDPTWSDIKMIFLTEFNKIKWTNLKNNFSNVLSTIELKENFIHELSRLEYNFKKIQYQILMTKPSPLTLWNSLKKDYPIIYQLSKALLVLPRSSVNVERIFSNLKHIHNPSRNRLTLENLEACLLAYQHYRDSKMPIDFELFKKDVDSSESSNALTNQEIIEEESEKEDYFGININLVKRSLKKKATTEMDRDYKKLKY